MKTIEVVYENGVFRPLEPVDLPERSSARVQYGDAAEDDAVDAKVYDILGERYSSGDPFGAERHNEHQP